MKIILCLQLLTIIKNGILSHMVSFKYLELISSTLMEYILLQEMERQESDYSLLQEMEQQDSQESA